LQNLKILKQNPMQAHHEVVVVMVEAVHYPKPAQGMREGFSKRYSHTPPNLAGQGTPAEAPKDEAREASKLPRMQAARTTWWQRSSCPQLRARLPACAASGPHRSRPRHGLYQAQHARSGVVPCQLASTHWHTMAVMAVAALGPAHQRRSSESACRTGWPRERAAPPAWS
jgi:hypothetical protein